MRNNPTPAVYCLYGAPMGRHTGPEYLEPTSGHITLQRIPINGGGYDRGGAYWGLGQPLYYAADNDGNEIFFRSKSREAAKAHLREMFGDLMFHR